jgi:cytoskeletal protein CcmA (bactofilin family)
MSRLGKSIVVKGELRASEDITLEGRVDGPITCEHRAVVLSPTAVVTGSIIAREITVFGQIDGQLIATDRVAIRRHARVTGQVAAKRFVLEDEAHFNGRVKPQHLDAVLGIARYEQRKRDAEALEAAAAIS